MSSTERTMKTLEVLAGLVEKVAGLEKLFDERTASINQRLDQKDKEDAQRDLDLRALADNKLASDTRSGIIKLGVNIIWGLMGGVICTLLTIWASEVVFGEAEPGINKSDKQVEAKENEDEQP